MQANKTKKSKSSNKNSSQKKSEKKSNASTAVGSFVHTKIVRSQFHSSESATVPQTEVVAFSFTDAAVHFAKDYRQFDVVANRLREDAELATNNGGTSFVRYYSNGEGAGKNHLLLLSLGNDGKGVNKFGAAERVRRLGALVQQKVSAEKLNTVVVHLNSFHVSSAKLNASSEEMAAAFLEGFALAAYQFKKYFTKPNKSRPFEVVLVAADATQEAAFEKGLNRAQAIVSGTEVCRNLGNEPSNYLTPKVYADTAVQLAKRFGLKTKVLTEREMAKEGMGLLLGVGQGSVNPPRLVVLEYAPKKYNKTIALVGKGITFDSGGISIKPSARMEDMKHDMCGSSAVLGATLAAAQLKLPVRIYCVVALAENMPSGNAIQPGNILKSRAGKTVEVTNTDAEGRLILADALDYIQDSKPDYIIDLATLTGAVSITLGRACAGLMSNDDDYTRLILNAAGHSGERLWELPLFDEYFDDLKSEYADMRNSGDSPSHGTAKAAMFMAQFIRPEQKWAHLDIAAVAYGMGQVPYNPKKASSGFGVRLLVSLAESLG